MPDVTYLPEHRWVASAHLPMTDRETRRALRLGWMMLGPLRVDILDVRCARCGCYHVRCPAGCPGDGGAHTWQADANIPLTDRQVRVAWRTGWVALPGGARADALDLLCSRCRLPWDEAADEPCAIGIHLHGGPIGTRKKRKGPTADATVPPDAT